MSVETRGTVQMKGASGRGVQVVVVADDGRLVVTSGEEVIGDWDTSSLGIQSLNDGFAIKTGGEEIILKTENDPGLVEELGITAVSPRLGRKVAASHPPEERVDDPEPEPVKSNLGPILFALGGVLVLTGGFFIRQDPGLSAADQAVLSGLGSAGSFWLAFVAGGLLMAAVGWFMTLSSRLARFLAAVSLLIVIAIFGFAVSSVEGDASHLLAYGFIAGGIVVGVAVIFSENLNDTP
jgi:hypothetical protein